jgi:hypothetical protein
MFGTSHFVKSGSQELSPAHGRVEWAHDFPLSFRGTGVACRYAFARPTRPDSRTSTAEATRDSSLPTAPGGEAAPPSAATRERHGMSHSQERRGMPAPSVPETCTYSSLR